jgi:hypothetical protein
MNERIRELAEQAEIYAGELIDEGADYDQYPRYYTEKFAELIVRECASMARVYQSHKYDFTGDSELDEFMLKHFGVEE